LIAGPIDPIQLCFAASKQGVLTLDIDVRKVADLARIRLTDDEAGALGPQLKNILGYVDSLQQLDTGNVEPTAHPHDAAMPLRLDTVTNTNRRDELQASAPKLEAGLYVVPKVIE